MYLVNFKYFMYNDAFSLYSIKIVKTFKTGYENFRFQVELSEQGGLYLNSKTSFSENKF